MFRIASFNGRANRSKIKAWAYLASVKAKGQSGASINQIHESTGVPLGTLRQHMDKWWSWGRISKRLLPKRLWDGSTCLYSITPFGLEYLEKVVPDDVWQDCLDEIKEWQEQRRAMSELAEAEHRKRLEAIKARMIAQGHKGIVPRPS